jgi:outer membrane cobalamin receptor
MRLSRPFQFLVVLAACSCVILGEDLRIQVLDSRNGAVPGASVAVFDGTARSARVSGTSDVTGCLVVPGGTVTLPATVRVTATGFEPAETAVPGETSEPVIMRLRPAVIHTTVDVVVTDVTELRDSSERASFEIARTGARTVYDALDQLFPSAYITRKGVLGHGLGASNSITLRGIGGSPTTQLLMVVDGRPDVMGLMGHPLPDCYSLTDVGSVRVTEGPASVLYGNRAMGGAVEITPASFPEGFNTEFTSTLGSYYTGQHRISHGGRFERFSYNLAAGLEHTNGDRPNSSFRNQDGSLRLGYNVTPGWQLSMDGRYAHFNVEDPGTVSQPQAGLWSRVGRGGYSVSLRNMTSRTLGSIHFFSSYGHHMIYDGFRSIDNNTGVRVVQNLQVRPDLTLELGGDTARYGGRARNIKAALDYGDHYVSEGGAFLRAAWRATERFRLNSGFRYEHNSATGDVAVPEFGASYRLSSQYSLSIAIGKGFRNPTIRELYLFPAPTPTLRPERLWNYQGTFHFRPARSLVGWVTVYYADVRDLIVTTGRFPNLKLENVGRVANRGVDANARWQLHPRASVRVGVAHLGSTDLAPYAPENKLNCALELDASKAIVTLSAITVGRTWFDTAHSRQLSGYTVANMGAAVPIAARTSLLFSIDNLFDREYEVLNGYPMAGITGTAGFTVRF